MSIQLEKENYTVFSHHHGIEDDNELTQLKGLRHIIDITNHLRRFDHIAGQIE
jgi:hypothetical protein